MNELVEYVRNRASEAQVASHLRACDRAFVPSLATRVNIGDYATKILTAAERFEAWSDDRLVGLVAVYCNDRATRLAYITSVSVLDEWRGKGVASSLLQQCVEYVRELLFPKIQLEVAVENAAAVSLYTKWGFSVEGVKGGSLIMGIKV